MDKKHVAPFVQRNKGLRRNACLCESPGDLGAKQRVPRGKEGKCKASESKSDLSGSYFIGKENATGGKAQSLESHWEAWSFVGFLPVTS